MTNKNTYTELGKNKLQRIINTSVSLSDVLTKLGLSNNGSGSYFMLNKYIKIFNIDIAFMEINKKHRAYNKDPKKKLSHKELFIANSTISRSTIRRRILSENLLPYKCNECGIPPIWRGNPLSLHLEHINGVNNDHRLENLCFLCPQCHSQTKTYAGRNNTKEFKKQVKHICDKCGKPKSHGAILCKDCADEKAQYVPRPTKETLWEEIQTTPFTTLGKQYDVSDNAIRKWCKTYGLPHTKKGIKEFKK